MNKRIFIKILATILVLMLTFSNVIMLAVYAVSESIENQQTAISKTKIEFDAYFISEDRKVHSLISDISSDNLKLYLSVKVAEGNLNNAEAVLSSSNFKFKEYKDEQGLIQSIDLQNNKIFFNGMNKGTDVTIEIPVEIRRDNLINADYFKTESTITLSGEYLNNSGEKINISKDINVFLQLHGDAHISIEQTIDKYVPFNTNNEKGSLLQSTVKIVIENNILPIKQVGINIEVPVINNVKPTNVVVVGRDSSYSKQTGVLTITANNDVQEDKILWNNNELDTYKIIYIYDENGYTNNEVTTRQNLQAVVSVYNDSETVLNEASNGNIILKDKMNDIVTNTVTTDVQELYKGLLYNSSNNETNYQTIWKADIGYSNLIDEIILSEDGDKFVYNTNAREMFAPSNSYYKTTYVTKENFDRILGVDGYIDIYDANANKIGRINKESVLDENNNYVFSYINETNKITIKTSKPVENIKGEELVIKNDKAIKSSNSYSLEWLKAFTQIKTTLNEKEARINLGEIETVVNATVSRNTLSTSVTNNVEFTVALRTDSAKYQLYKNPVIDIKIPSYVSVELGNVDVLYGNGQLNVASSNVYEDNAGNKIIRVVLNGEQTDYELNSANKGANLFVSANLTTNKFMPSQEANIEVTCTNMKDGSVSNSNIDMNFVSESGILMANSISNYNGEESITSLKGDTKIGNLAMNSQAKVATMGITLINNEKTDISGAVILGRLPYEGGKTVASQKELESTFTVELKSLINTNGINATVYYSENGDADTDLQKVGNKWTNQATTNVKSYMIIFNEEFKKAQTVNFEYQITIPENLGTNEVAYSNYAVLYNNQIVDSPIVGVATEFVMLQQYRSQLEERNISVTNAAQQTTPRGENLVTINMQHINQGTIDSSKVGLNYEYTYLIRVKNNTYYELNSVKVTDILSRNVKYEESSVISSDRDVQEILRNDLKPVYDENNHNVTVNIPRLEIQEEIVLQIKVKVESYSSEIINNCIVTNEDIYKTDSYSIPMKSPAVVSANLSGSELSEQVTQGQRIKYTILVENSGEDTAYVAVEDDLPEGLKLQKATYYLDNAKYEMDEFADNNFILPKMSIVSGRGLKVELEVNVEELPEDILQRDLETFAVITGTNINIKTNTVKYIVKKDQSSPNDPTNSVKKSISGIVWNDENKNGKRDTGEVGISNIAVKLFNSTGQSVGESKTDSSGSYKLENLDNGKYIVMFEYDSKLYGVTVYKKDDVIETLNSDAKEATYNGNKVAMTDSLEIKDSSLTNINLGLIKNSIFDLKLDKYIDSITVQNDQGVTTYSYTDTNFAKVELVAKYIPSTTVILNYKIVVTNEGDVAGYAKQIVDYMPQDLKFSSELNKDWYVNTDGNLYTAGLANIIINPGETKEVELLVTKKMTENNTGLITNQAEIAESYNEQGIEEYDSIAANKNQNEDDISNASVIIGVKTGGIALYLTITLICIALIAVGSYVINKKVLRGIK